MDESQNHAQWKKPYTRAHTLSPFCEELEQAEVTHVETHQNIGASRGWAGKLLRRDIKEHSGIMRFGFTYVCTSLNSYKDTLEIRAVHATKEKEESKHILNSNWWYTRESISTYFDMHEK